MTNEERNKIIAEALGLCWHVRKYSINSPTFGRCIKCGVIYASHPDFSTWDGFGLIMERGTERRWWKCFINKIGGFSSIDLLEDDQELMEPDDYIPVSTINPPIMFTELSTWLSENEKEWRKG